MKLEQKLRMRSLYETLYMIVQPAETHTYERLVQDFGVVHGSAPSSVKVAQQCDQDRGSEYRRCGEYDPRFACCPSHASATRWAERR